MKRLFLVIALFIVCLSLLPAPLFGQGGCPTTKIITISPKSGPVGTEVDFTGQVDCMGIGASYSVFWDNLDGPQLTADIAESYDISGSFVIPEAPYGKHQLFLYAHKTQTKSSSEFKVIPTFTSTPTSASPGTEVKLIGNGFPASESIKMTFDAAELETANTDAQGVFTATIAIPITFSGNHPVSATNAKLSAADTPKINFTVVPNIDVDNTAPAIGSKVKVSGEGFAAQSEITIKYDDSVIETNEEDVTTDDNGSFQATIVIPSSSKTSHKLTATDASGGTASGNMATMTLELEKDAPPQPMPITPINQRFGIYGSKVVTFEWKAVEDPSGITYTIEIGKDTTIFPQQRIKKGLTEPGYTLAPDEALPQGTYYWHVKAVDGAGNESQWSAPYPFKIGLFPLWGFVILGLIALIIVIYIIRAALRFLVALFRYY